MSEMECQEKKDVTCDEPGEIISPKLSQCLEKMYPGLKNMTAEKMTAITLRLPTTAIELTLRGRLLTINRNGEEFKMYQEEIPALIHTLLNSFMPFSSELEDDYEEEDILKTVK